MIFIRLGHLFSQYLICHVPGERRQVHVEGILAAVDREMQHTEPQKRAVLSLLKSALNLTLSPSLIGQV